MQDIDIYKEIAEVEEHKDNLKKLSDGILDLYKKYPDICGNLLKEVNTITSELDSIEKELELLKSEIY